ncbi:MAG: methionine synthase [Pseudomonadota bacterium]|nr:methionine synthase [Pseudomonadota bacterium]
MSHQSPSSKSQPRNSLFLDALDDRILLFDGGMGTQLMGFNLPLSDYNGLENCSEILCATRPDVVGAIHRRYFEAGADVVETNSFGGAPWVLAEFGLAADCHSLNKRSAEIAREAADAYATANRPRFVCGSIGPGTRLPTLGHIGWDEMFAGYQEQVRGLLDGGVDVLLVETCQDLLQTKCALASIFAVFAATGRKVPVMAQVTMETTGTMLLGSDVATAATVLEQYPIDIIGLNCATGPVEMAAHISYLGRHAKSRISVLPNAGLPQLVDGKTCYPLSPRELADWHERFIKEDGVAIVGGCCGTGPEHIRAVAERILGVKPKHRSPEFVPAAASLYGTAPLRQQADIFAVGERTNANGSRQFKRLLDAQDWDGMVGMGKTQVKGGSHAIDVCVAFVGRDEVRDMDELVKRLATAVHAPLVIDSTELPVLEAALKRIGGKPIVNSINLEDGEDRLDKVCQLCRTHGAAVIALTIDEEGMAKTPERKLEVARRIHDLAVERHGMSPDDILFDPLTFTICTGNEDDRKLGLWTLEGIRLIAEHFPRCGILLGLSNISFGINPHARHVLNSVYLHHAREAGLTAAIVHADKITPLYKIPPEQRQVCEDLIFDRRRVATEGDSGYDPLQALLAMFADAKAEKVEKKVDATVEERLKDRIVDGERPGIEADLNEAMTRYKPLQIINEILLDGMKVVGELFGSGQMQLPFVLQSAETMKYAVAFLQPYMEKSEGPQKGTMVLATVRGDVHDIGKNLVDIILTNNGYRVVNIGIKQPIDQILKAAREENADAIGMSGLLVKSTVIMKENMEEMRRQGFTTPVVLGGAALTRAYVEQDCSSTYGRKVVYAKDAFAGLNFMEHLATFDDTLDLAEASPSEPVVPARAERPIPYDARDAEPIVEVTAPVPPFFGARVVDVPLKALVPFINEDVLYKFQWGFLRKNLTTEEHKEQLRTVARPILVDLADRCAREGILKPQAVYGWFRCKKDGDALVLEDGTRLGFPRQKVVGAPGAGEVPRNAPPGSLTPTAAGGGARGPIAGAPTGLGAAAESGATPVAPLVGGFGHGDGLCIADYFNDHDVVGLMAVTVGQHASEVAREWFAENRYTEYLYLHGFGVEITEALAEFTHRQMRAELGIAGDDARDLKDLFHKQYRGARYAYGYPSCPDMADQRHLLRLLGAERIGISMADEDQLHPEQSTAAIVVHHPQARYFKV